MNRVLSLAAAVLLAVSGLTGCAVFKAADFATTRVDKADLVKALDIAKGTYAVALVVATEYAELARCGDPGVGAVCSQRAVLVQAVRLRRAARTAIDAADRAMADLSTNPTLAAVAVKGAQDAVGAWKAIADTMKGEMK